MEELKTKFKVQKLRTYNFKTKAGNNYVSEMFKVDKGVYKFKTTLNNKPVAEEKDLELKTALILEAHIREVIKKYEKDAGVEEVEEPRLSDEEVQNIEDREDILDIPKLEEVEEDDEDKELAEFSEELVDLDEKEMKEAIAENLGDEEEDVADSDEVLRDEYEKSTGKKAIYRGKVTKGFLKWKKALNNK